VKKCAKCEEFGPLHHTRPEELHNIISSWSFTIWEIDIIGPFSLGKGQTKFLLMEEGQAHLTMKVKAQH